ncbi:hypothetical protein RhiirB3_492244 [Rhizophagus irregularis]|nr:hypothetical protein RhiirB3_492244 [Rhizophagus irregularis]
MSSDKISIKVDDDMSNDLKDEINKIDENDIINDDSDIDINKPAYIDKPIIKVSPNGEYLVVYNPEDHSIVGWNVKDIEEGQLTKSDAPIKVNDSIDQISVSDDKKLAYTFYKKNEYLLKIIDINNNQKIKLSLNIELLSCPYHTFNLKDEFLLYDNWNTYDRYYHKKYKIIWIYSTQAKNYKWICKRIYKIPEYFELINMSKYDKLYLISNNSIYEWDLDAEKGTKIFYINDKEFKSHYSKRELKISSNEMFICLRIMDGFIIYSIESAIPIISLDMNNDNSLYKSVKYSKLLPSLLPLLSSKTLNPIMEYCWEKCLTRLGLKDENLQTLPSFLIYHFNENKKSMSLIYWNYLELTYPNVDNLDNRSVNINDPNINDPNNPWKLAPTYNQIFENGTNNPFLIQPPNENTNMFIDFKTSLFTMYKFLTGDPSALSNWTYLNNPPLVILIVLFSFLIVVYLMNLFIGLLNNAINKDYNRVSYLVQKAEILAEIELFYLLPHQRRWKEWFPEVIHYSAKINDVRKEVEKMMNQDEWNTNAFPELKDDLLKKLNIQQIPDK